MSTLSDTRREAKALRAQGQKRCSLCKEVKFFADYSSPSQSYCRPCFKEWNRLYREENREKVNKQWVDQRKRRLARDEEGTRLADWTAYLKYTYRISPDDYNTMFVSQKGLCGICGKAEVGRRLAVDHDRRCCSGKRSCGKCVRGLLCSSCNPKLGFYEIFEAEVEQWRNQRFAGNVEE